MNLFNIHPSNELCFDQNEFLKKNFSVDEFLHQNRSASLETFRDDLGIYLKILRSSMIELINEDYADFVSLSGNFVGLDKSIDQIKNPLVELKEELEHIRNSLQETMNEINECLSEKRRFRQIKKSLEALEIVVHLTVKLNKLLKLVEASESENQIVLLERAALELIQLQFNARYCTNFLDSKEKASIDEQEQKLLEILNNFFIATLEKNDPTSDKLERSLRIYYSLDQCGLAEKVFRKEVFNYMEGIISERNLQNFSDGLTGVYNEILNFISLKMKLLLNLTRGKSMKIKGFNFLFNSFWSAIEERLELNLSSIFAPAIPEEFYQRYKCTCQFLERIEMIIEDPVLIQQFHQNEQYVKFQKKWNLPVYFLIRSQEIATSLEKTCEFNENTMQITQIESNQIQSKVFLEIINCIAKCWSDGIYLDQLFQNFLKLTFQLIARGIRWSKDVIKSASNSDLDLFAFHTVLHLDIEILIRKFPQIEQLIIQKLTENQKLKDKISTSALSKCFESPRASFEQCQKDIEAQISKKLSFLCNKSMKSVQDIPRLFRKTNREVPTKNLPYVDQILMAVNDFDQKHKKNYQPDIFKRILKDLFSQTTIQYYQLVNEVLTSVQKTEESIRRLKNLREKSQQTTSTSEKQQISDDDKIRLQLQLDINHYVKNIESFHLERKEIDSLNELISLTNDISKKALN